MDLNEMKVKDFLKLAEIFNNKNQEQEKIPLEEGKAYFIRTVTLYQLGRLKKLTSNALVLEDASWIADTGTFTDFLSGKKSANEMEIFPDGCIVLTGAIVDICPWSMELPRERK